MEKERKKERDDKGGRCNGGMNRDVPAPLNQDKEKREDTVEGKQNRPSSCNNNRRKKRERETYFSTPR